MLRKTIVYVNDFVACFGLLCSAILLIGIDTLVGFEWHKTKQIVFLGRDAEASEFIWDMILLLREKSLWITVILLLVSVHSVFLSIAFRKKWI